MIPIGGLHSVANCLKINFCLGILLKMEMKEQKIVLDIPLQDKWPKPNLLLKIKIPKAAKFVLIVSFLCNSPSVVNCLEAWNFTNANNKG